MEEKLALAIQHRTAGQLEAARALFAQLDAEHPDNAAVNYHYAWLFDKLGEETSAIPYYEKAVALGLPPEDLKGALLGLGSTYRCTGQYDKAAATLQRGAELYPDCGVFRVFLAMALYNLGQPRQAVSMLLHLLTETSHEEGVHAYKGAIDFYADHLDETWR